MIALLLAAMFTSTIPAPSIPAWYAVRVSADFVDRRTANEMHKLMCPEVRIPRNWFHTWKRR